MAPQFRTLEAIINKRRHDEQISKVYTAELVVLVECIREGLVSCLEIPAIEPIAVTVDEDVAQGGHTVAPGSVKERMASVRGFVKSLFGEKK
jgi:hypothetical protein